MALADFAAGSRLLYQVNFRMAEVIAKTPAQMRAQEYCWITRKTTPFVS